MRSSTLNLLSGIVVLMTACSPVAWTPPDEEIRNQAFVECLRGQLETCGVDPTPLDACTPFDWDSLFVADHTVLTRDVDRWKDANEDLADAIQDRPDAQLMDFGGSAFFFFDRGVVVDVLKVGFSEIDSRNLVGAYLSKEEAVFSNRAVLGVYGQPVLVPYFEAPRELSDDLVVWHVSRRIIADSQHRNFCVTEVIAPLIPRIENEIRAANPESTVRKKLYTFSECRMPSSPIDDSVTVAGTGERATKLFFSVNPVFFSETKVKINYGSNTASLSSFSASSIVIRTERGWETQVSWVKSVS